MHGISANRDEDAFDNPDAFDLDRKVATVAGIRYLARDMLHWAVLLLKVELNSANKRHSRICPHIRP